MKTINYIKHKSEIGSNTPKKWTINELNKLKSIANENHKNRTPKQIIENEMNAIHFELEEYVNNNISYFISLEDAVNKYLDVLNISFRKFALSLDTSDTNLKKYLRGVRVFNYELALKFSHFFHTPADLWLRIQMKNELMSLNQNKTIVQYKKYDYKKLLSVVNEK